MISIAIDGPSGAGKSTLAKALAKKLGYIYVDTGAMYRSLALFVLRKEIDPSDEKAVSEILPEINIEMRYENGIQHMLLCGEDVTDKIRTNEVSMTASKVSALPSVRAFLLDMQKNIAEINNVIMDGRDIGTVILPFATVKFFLNASEEQKAIRRHTELLQKGENVTLEEVKKTMAERDKNDKTRKIAPAVPAPDAIMLDNSKSFEETMETALQIISERIK